MATVVFIAFPPPYVDRDKNVDCAQGGFKVPIKSGEQFLGEVNCLNHHVTLDGSKVSGPISEHRAFRGTALSVAALYDMQNSKELRTKMTYQSPLTGDLVGLSFLSPKTKGELKRRRNMMALWGDYHHGFLGRSPDYMNTAIMAYASAADAVSEVNAEYADNLKLYYEYCRENDITLSHAFVQPVGSRMSALLDSFEDCKAAKVLEFDNEGMIVSGAFLLATQAATSQEILIFPSPLMSFGGDNPFVFAFAIPVDSPGLTLVCRESYVHGESRYDYPLSSRFEEMDALVLCDNVRVPRNRIFLYGNPEVANVLQVESQFHAHVSHQVLCRYIAKTEFFLGTAECLAELVGVSSDALSEQIGELVTILHILKSLLTECEEKAKRNRWGVMVPDQDSMLVANSYFPKVYPRMIEVIQRMAGDRLIMIPSKADFETHNADILQRYLEISDHGGEDVVALGRLAWELSTNSFAGRQTQYERFFFGGPATVSNRLYSGYSELGRFAEKVRRFLDFESSE